MSHLPAFEIIHGGAHDPGRRLDLPSTLASTTRFRTWTTILVATQLVDDLRENGPFAIFAPTDEAFDALPPGSLEDLLHVTSLERLIDLGERHIVRGRSRSGVHMKTLFGSTLWLDAAGRIRPHGVRVKDRRIASNGIIYAVDQVLGTLLR